MLSPVVRNARRSEIRNEVVHKRRRGGGDRIHLSTEEGTRGGGSRELSGLGEVCESGLGITSGSVGSGITSVDDAGVVGFDVDEDALEGNAVGDGAFIQVDHLDESGGFRRLRRRQR